ncbi:MAG TPA: FtsQ-type POTRA domain-containing protein [Acidimicrobiales bacterium]|nr:FtsQ-type POTRA domain-containing protein [Acidimicrobiales bacterium]
MDPRIRRRRLEVRRKEGRRRLRVLVGITAVAVLGGGGWAATGSPLLDLDRIAVEGTVHTTVEEARFASGLRLGEPLVDVDEEAAARGLQTLPWVDRATVRRRWPGEVRIRVVERQPVAVTGLEGGGVALLDESGRVLEWVEGPPPALPLLSGLPPAGPPGSTVPPESVAALAVAVALPEELRARTLGVAPGDGGRGEVEIRLDPEGTVRLGPPVDLDRKFDAIRAVFDQVDLGNLAVLDVRRPDMPVLTRRDSPPRVSTPRVG